MNNYPIKFKFSYFEYPWNCYGGWKNWFLCDWQILDNKNKSIYIGYRFLGYTKVLCIWICNKKEAGKHRLIEDKRLIDLLCNIK